MLNGVKATITFHDTIGADKPTINWDLIIESGENKAGIDGSISMSIKLFEPSTPHPSPAFEPIVPIAPIAPESEEDEEEAESEEDEDDEEEAESEEDEEAEEEEEDEEDEEDEEKVKDKVLPYEAVRKHVFKALKPVTNEDMKNHIFKCIKAVEYSVDKKQKAKLAQILYDYMTNESLDYVKGYELLKKVAIERAYSFKKDCKEFPKLIASLDAFLTAVSPLDDMEPVVEPVKDCACTKCIEKETMKEIMKEDDEYYKRWQLMKKLFERENLVFDDNVMDLYYEWEKTAPRLNRYKKIKAFIDANRDAFEDPELEARKTLMKSIFQKKNLEFKDVYMDMYYEWEKNAPRLNRYKKMCSFIEVQGF
jgi:hypothetical protein